VFAYLTSGAFVIDDRNATLGQTVTFSSPQWCEQNGETGSCPSAFKGFADSPAPGAYTDGPTWTAHPGQSGNPPNQLPTYMAVITTTNATKNGPTISGMIIHVVVVKLSPSEGTGEVVAVLS
jgi:hypothetical protein